MPKIPGAEALGGLPSGRSGRPIASVDTSAEAEGIQAFGRDVEQVSKELRARWDTARALDTERRYQEFKFSEQKAYDEAVRTMQPGQARDFANRYSDGYVTRAKEFARANLDGLPPELRGEYDGKLFNVEQTLFNAAAEFEHQEQKRFSAGAIDTTVNNVILPKAEAAAKLPAGDPRKAALLAEAQSGALDLVNKNPDFTPIERDAAAKAVRERVQTIFAGALPADERRLLASGGGEASVADRIVSIERGSKPDAKNPESSATGDGQFIDQTWLGMVRKYHPELARGRSEDEVLALRANSGLSKEMVNRYAAENAQYLGARGIGASDGNLYLAHFLGPAGAAAVLNSDPNSDVSKVLPSAAISANASILKGKAASEVVDWAHRKMGEATPTDWASTLDALPAETRIKLSDEGETEWRKTKINDLFTRINDGVAGEQDIQAARSEGWLTDAETIVRAQKALDDTVNHVSAAKAFSNPDYRFNPFDSDDQKRVDLVYEKGPLAGGATLLDGDADAVQGLRTVIDRTGIVPTKAKDALRSGIWTGTKEERRTALTILDGLYRERPDVIAKALDDKDQARLDEYQQLAGIYTPAEIDERFDPAKNPQMAKRRQELRAEGEKLVKDVDVSSILDAFDPGLFTTGPSEPPDPTMLGMLLDDYRTAYAESYSVIGNQDRANSEAIKRLKDSGKWGTTDVGEGRYLMPYPPEAFYPAVDGSHEWMDEQLSDLVKERAPEAESWSVVMLPETQSIVQYNRANPQDQQPVPYGVAYLDADGLPQMLTVDDRSVAPLVVAFDYGKVRDKRREEFGKERSALPAVEPEAAAEDTGEPITLAPIDVPEGYVMPFKPAAGAGLPELQ